MSVSLRRAATHGWCVWCVVWLAASSAIAANFDSDWGAGVDRTWVGPDYWANRLQDWRIIDGRVECLEASPQRPMRTLQLLSATLDGEPGEVVMSVRMGALQPGLKRSADSWAGLLIGAGGKDIDYRITALTHHRSAEDGGILVAVDGSGRIIFRDNNRGSDLDEGTAGAGNLRPNEMTVLAPAMRHGGGFVGNQTYDDIELRVEARSIGDKYTVTATALLRGTGHVLSSAELRGVDPREIEGSVALVSHLGGHGSTAGYWFREWKIAGRKLVLRPERACGPIYCTQYTLHRGVLKLTAQMPPLGARDSSSARLEVRAGAHEPWRLAGRAQLTQPGFLFPFRVEKWDAKEDLQFRIVYDLLTGLDRKQVQTWEGVIRQPPTDREEVVVAVLAGSKSHTGGLKWNQNGMWFPHTDLTAAVAAQNPDVLFFAGNQVYEADIAGGQRTPLDKATLDYLDKWYRWCWAFGDLTRQRPTVCIPSVQDLYHVNLWGAGGRAARQSADEGGYLMPAEFINLVQQTQTSHLPDAVDPRPVGQGIDVFFTRFEYAGVSFAILEDRKFKSSPTTMIPDGRVVNGRFQNPRFEPGREADVAGAELLGDRQQKFLRDWAADWSQGVWMKAVLSPSLFANVATWPRDAATMKRKRLKSGEYPTGERLAADADSNAWPQTGRNTALREMRRAFAVHLAGDQQLGSLVHYGVDDWNDAGYGFSVPSISNPLPHHWYPSEPGARRAPNAPKYTGQFKDGFGNHLTVLAVANPEASSQEPAALYDRAPGYGIVRFQRKTRQITFECWPRWVKPGQDGAQQFAGWPITVDQISNYGRAAKAYLPEVKVQGLIDPVVQVVDESTGETVYTLRIRGEAYRPPVFRPGHYTVRIGEPGTAQMKLLSGLEASTATTAALTVDFAAGPPELISSGAAATRK